MLKNDNVPNSFYRFIQNVYFFLYNKMSEQIDESGIQIEQKDKKKPKLIKLL